jgi:hypothetical protein
MAKELVAARADVRPGVRLPFFRALLASAGDPAVIVQAAPQTLPGRAMNMRFGLKAQAQCRATLETLAAIKNPPTVFARQANIADGAAAGEQHGTYGRQFARAGNFRNCADRSVTSVS